MKTFKNKNPKTSVRYRMWWRKNTVQNLHFVTLLLYSNMICIIIYTAFLWQRFSRLIFVRRLIHSSASRRVCNFFIPRPVKRFHAIIIYTLYTRTPLRVFRHDKSKNLFLGKKILYSNYYNILYTVYTQTEENCIN